MKKRVLGLRRKHKISLIILIGVGVFLGIVIIFTMFDKIDENGFGLYSEGLFGESYGYDNGYGDDGNGGGGNADGGCWDSDNTIEEYDDSNDKKGQTGDGENIFIDFCVESGLSKGNLIEYYCDENEIIRFYSLKPKNKYKCFDGKFVQDICYPKPCSAFEGECGELDNGCGGMIKCTCDYYDECNYNGLNGMCIRKDECILDEECSEKCYNHACLDMDFIIVEGKIIFEDLNGNILLKDNQDNFLANVGDKIIGKIYIKDLSNKGVFANYANLEIFNNKIINLENLKLNSEFSNSLINKKEGEIWVIGGARGKITPVGGGYMLFASFKITGNSPGNVIFKLNPSYGDRNYDKTLIYNRDTEILPEEINYIETKLKIT